jgi:hypothetical protein
MRRLVGITCGLVAMVLAPSVAFADDEVAQLPPAQPPPAGSVTESTTATVDTVHLRSGGMFRGRVTEIVPGDHVTVLLTTGESRRVVWRDVDRVIVASTAVPPLASAPAAAASAAMVGPRARVHVKAPHPSFLYRRAAGTTDFITACESPCDMEMPIGDTYKIGGSGFSTTSEFKLDAPPGGSVELTVDGPNWAGIVGGGAITIGGGFTAYVGVILALTGSSCSNDRYSSSNYDNNCTEVRNVGLGAMAVGAGMIALGLLIVFPSLKTDFSQQKGTAAKDAFVRTPTWRSASSTGEGGSPATFPLLYEGRF